MRNVLGLFLCIAVCSCASRPADNPNGVVRIRFVPGAAPTSPLESCQGAVWTALSPGMFGGPDQSTAQADAAIGDTFPVQRKGGPTLFKVRLKDRDDAHLILEILTGQESKALDLARDKKKSLTIAGASYRFYYPSKEVAASDNKTTTNKAMILISTKP